MKLELSDEEIYIVGVLCLSLLHNTFLIHSNTPLPSGAKADVIADNIYRKITRS